ncbi:MAG: hypothetical protein Q8P20_03370 [bacterium]|nr:hypothetical protein [bacterium]
MNQFRKNQSGSVLLYSLLVISLITAIAIIISIIVVNEIKLTSAASNGIQSYYAAESGIESGLYAMKIIRNDQSITLDQAVIDIGNLNGTNFENNASYDNLQTKSITSKVENVEVKENDYIQIEYYDVNNPLNPSYEVVGITVRNSGNNPATWAEVSWTAWDNQGILGTSIDAKKFIGPSDLARTNGWPINELDVFEADPLPLGTGFDGNPVGYRVRVKALKAIPTAIGNGDLSSLTVIPYDGVPPPLDPSSNEVTNLPSQLVIKSIGERNNFKQSLTATVPWNLPLFGLYDYVLFSESDILKDIILSSPTYSSGVIEIESSIDPVDSCVDQLCYDCQSIHFWDGLCPAGAPDVTCFGSSNNEDLVSGIPIPGQCKIMPEVGFLLYGFTLPIPDTIPAGDEYYVSYRAFYDCAVPTNCDGRSLAVELSGNSNIVNDQSVGIDEQWVSCTIPYTYSLGDPQLPEDDPTRIIKIFNHPYGDTWTAGDSVRIDWYQLSTYKIFPDCY